MVSRFGDTGVTYYEGWQTFSKKKWEPSLETMVQNIHKKSRKDERVRSYFSKRGINSKSIDRFQLGIEEFDGYDRFVIPVYDKTGKVAYLKLRITPENESASEIAETMGQETLIDKYEIYPADAERILVGEEELVKTDSSDVLICKGELDRIIAIQEGVNMSVVTGGGIVQGFKEEWIELLRGKRNIYLCLGENAVGKRGAKILAQRLAKQIPSASIYIISLPFKDNKCADLTDYFVEKRGTAKKLFTKYAKFCCGAEPIDPKKFREMTVDEVAKVLDLTIKHDYANKVIVFLAMLTTYTELDQLNIMFSARSATGKSHITIETSKLFPPEDVKMYGIISATAMFYNQDFEKKDEKTGREYIDLERKILILVEMPDPEFMERLRALLSHDEKMIKFAITNKGKGGKNCSNDRYLLGFPSVFFCSANMKIDEQEQTRCIILSPESTQEKIKASIDAAFAKSSDEDKYRAMVESNPDRKLLKDRIHYIKSLNVDTINIPDQEYLESRFLEDKAKLKSEDPRKSKQFSGLVKAIALLNAPFRMINGKVTATKADIDETMKLWKVIDESTIIGVPPQALAVYKNDIVPIYKKVNEDKGYKREEWEGITMNELSSYYYKREGVYFPVDYCKRNYIPILEAASLISYEQSERDKRRWVITPLKMLD